MEYDKYLAMFFIALDNVKEKYLVYNNEPDDNDSDKEKYIEHVERVFAYELYRQWANLLEYDEEYVLNAEIGKSGTHCMEGYKRYDEDNAWKKYMGDKTSIYPDMVLHSGQGTLKHKIVCEIKRNKSVDGNNMMADLKKLMFMTSDNFCSKNPYEYGIFLLFDTTFEKIVESLDVNSIKVFEHENNFEKIILVSYGFSDRENHKDLKIEFDTLANVFFPLSYRGY
ncbi:MAG: hypothetical protein IJ413_10115 [Bacteroides sp.]|nr:hypothetical protein [Bacteroides sp.]